MKNESILFSILMPVYNGEKYIGKSIASVIEQTYENWELIIVDDASTDGTANIISSFSDKRIHYIRLQHNADQLNALLEAGKRASGQYIMFLHSDDTFTDNRALERILRAISIHSKKDGFYADIPTMDEDGKSIGLLKADNSKYNRLIKRIIFSYAGNPRFDVFVVRKSIFDGPVKINYLTDNTIYYLNCLSEKPILDIKKIEPWYRYRLYKGNYINSDIGKFVATNGPFRTIKRLYDAQLFMPSWVFKSRFVFRLLRKTGLWRFIPLKKNKKDPEALDAYLANWFIDLKNNSYPDILLKQITAIRQSISTLHNRAKPYEIFKIPDKIYDGKDARSFYKDYISGNLPKIYLDLLDKDYDHIVTTQELVTTVERIKKFICLDTDIIIK